MSEEREVKQWITVHGRRVPIFEGDTKKDALKRIMDKGPKAKSAERKHISDNEEIKAHQIARNEREKERLSVYTSNKADEGTQTEHRNAVKEIGSDKYEDGTYDIHTRKSLSFDTGYQVTFCQIGDDYTDAEYAKKVNECLRLSSDGKTYAGKFGGSPEISFHFSSRKLAYEYADANNQVSILDWAELKRDPDSPLAFISTNGTGIKKK